MKKQKLVSVIIPTKNRLDLLKEALQSVYEQTYKNLEIIVIDDGSTDDTPQFLKDEKKQGRLVYYRNKESMGGSKTRNVGIEKAKGDLIAFLDDDDIWMPKKIEKQVSLFTDEEVGLVYTGAQLIFEEIGVSYTSTPSISGNVFSELLIENRVGVTSSVMLHTKAAKEEKFDNSLPGRQDYDLWLRVSRNWKISGVQQPLVKVYSRNIKRITSDIRNYENAVATLNKKYAQDIAKLDDNTQKLRLAEQMFFLGSQAIKANNKSVARSYYMKSIKYKFSIKKLAAYFSTFFGIAFVIKLRSYLSK